ncbi:hypothetical protein ACGFW5_24630 [Streptomyces sp. NPDC048416]|uniref:hypothetical protein n=1 Tax=Streptomyces sp. NPDC048416 TaxID=3365546 RepID=UPI0037230DF5
MSAHTCFTTGTDSIRRAYTSRRRRAWARGRGLVGELEVPRARIAAPSVFMTDEEQAEQLHRCLGDDSLPLDVRTAGALTLLFGLQHT